MKYRNKALLVISPLIAVIKTLRCLNNGNPHSPSPHVFATVGIGPLGTNLSI